MPRFALPTLLVCLLPASYASGDDQVLTSVPTGAAVFGKEAGALFFYGHTPLDIPEEALRERRYLLLKPGYARREVDRAGLLAGPAELERLDGFASANCLVEPQSPAPPEAAAPLVDLRSRLEFVSPLYEQTAGGEPILAVTVRVVDRGLHGELRRVRRDEGVEAYMEAIGALATPVADSLFSLQGVARCYDRLLVRVVYAQRNVDMEWVRTRVPVFRKVTTEVGDIRTTTTTIGSTVVTNASVFMDLNNDQFLDILFEVPDE